MLTTQLPGLYISETDNKGRGVFTSSFIPSGSTIEICPCILLSPIDTRSIHKTLLHDYYFLWDLDTKSSAIALGFGSIYNHSKSPNAEFITLKDASEIKFVAISDIKIGDEITIDYIGLKDEGVGLWF